MKKIFIFIISIMMLLGSGSLLLASQNTFADEKQIVTIGDKDTLVSELKKEENFENPNVVLQLTAPIDLQDEDLNELVSDKFFEGTFDGNGYKISNMKISSKTQYYGLFPKAKNATIKNVCITGNVQFNIEEHNINELFVGGLVGYGENVSFYNCEFDNQNKEENKEEENDYKVQINVNSKVSFGMLAGKLSNSSATNVVNIENCVNYYDIDVKYKKETNVAVGSFVGSIDNCYLLNCLSFGKIEFANEVGTPAKINKVYVGGIVGGVTGIGTYIRNCCFGGTITQTNTGGVDIYAGGIVGGALSKQTLKENINFVYYSDTSLHPSGDDLLSISEKVAKQQIINKEFLDDKNAAERNFDPANRPFDFSTTWQVLDSRFHLQNFLSYTYKFDQQLDTRRILESASFSEKETTTSNTSRYNETVTMHLKLKTEYFKYYVLSSVKVNSNTLNSSYYSVEPVEEVDEESSLNYIVGYTITLTANDMTDGNYSFVLDPKGYNCIVTVSDEAKETKLGGVVIDNGQSLSHNDITLPFYYNSRQRTVSAVGEGIFTFDHWELYYKDEGEEFSSTPEEFERESDDVLTVAFGTAPYNREFKLVAFFTDEDAIKIDFKKLNNKMVSKIMLGSQEYAGEPLYVSPTSTQTLEIVLNKNYKLDVDEFTRYVQSLYGENSTSSLITSSPETNEEGLTTYRFSINMSYISEFEDNSLSFSFTINEDESNGMANLLWLYITLPIVVALIILAVVLIIIKKKRGGHGHSSGGSGTTKSKKVSYKDLY